MIYCPKCGGNTTNYDTRECPDNTQARRRECRDCGYRFKTIERIIDPDYKGGKPNGDATNAQEIQVGREGA